MGANAQTSVPKFTAGEVLTAANQNLSAGTGVPVFATTTTRDAAFGGTGEKVLAEGQTCYIEAAPKRLEVYNGSVWRTVSVGDWVSYTPTVTALSGTFTTVSATGAYSQIGKTIFVRFTVTITTNGTAGTAVVITLPASINSGTTDNSGIGGAREKTVTGNFCQVVTQGSSQASIFTTTNGYPGANNAIIAGSCFYEVA